MSEYAVDEVMDATGLYCPEPVMLLHNRVMDMKVGAVLEVRATDPSTKRDIPRFCQFLGHELLLSEERDAIYYYHIRKQAGS
ncbi:sulfurtransferase TusA [Hahella sp. SMD15-11]|uniref:Sulfurtransferase TusA n=1 Tax=Thermohahella caldifontis TaxID=3142973 RepID=A0AB39UZZ6_9GAMM